MKSVSPSEKVSEQGVLRISGHDWCPELSIPSSLGTAVTLSAMHKPGTGRQCGPTVSHSPDTLEQGTGTNRQMDPDNKSRSKGRGVSTTNLLKFALTIRSCPQGSSPNLWTQSFKSYNRLDKQKSGESPQSFLISWDCWLIPLPPGLNLLYQFSYPCFPSQAGCSGQLLFPIQALVCACVHIVLFTWNSPFQNTPPPFLI